MTYCRTEDTTGEQHGIGPPVPDAEPERVVGLKDLRFGHRPQKGTGCNCNYRRCCGRFRAFLIDFHECLVDDRKSQWLLADVAKVGIIPERQVSAEDAQNRLQGVRRSILKRGSETITVSSKRPTTRHLL